MKIGSAGVPHGHAIAAGIFKVEVRRGAGCAEEKAAEIVPVVGRASCPPHVRPLNRRAGESIPYLVVCERGEEFQLFRKSAQSPRQTPRPGAERRVALLRVWTAKRA